MTTIIVAGIVIILFYCFVYWGFTFLQKDNHIKSTNRRTSKIEIFTEEDTKKNLN